MLLNLFIILKKKLYLQCLVNKNFNSNGTFIPDDLQIIKKFNSNIFKKKHNKFFYLSFEIYSLIKRIILTILLIPFFLFNKNLKNYFNALISNKFIIPKYFIELFFFFEKK